MNQNQAWHFLSPGGLLRDGSEPPSNGEWLEYEGEIGICRSGLHASRRLVDALHYAPSPLCCLVEVDGIATEEDDKLVARRRRILHRLEIENILRDWARWCARQVVHLWDAPEVVKEYLETDNGDFRDAAWDTAWAAWAAADAAWAAWAAREASWAAREAAREAARAAQNEQLESMVLDAMEASQ